MISSTLKALDPSWQALIQKEQAKPYFNQLNHFLQAETAEGKTIFPPQHLWFEAYRQTPLDQVKVVIIGQDPYFRPNQAMGLSFSVPQGTKVPPSLRNVFKELASDIQAPIPEHGDLTRWAQQGILLLNASLTVEEGLPGGHLKQGWQTWTQATLDFINQHKKNVIFLAWGAFAHKCVADICTKKHNVIQTSHPSPLGARKGSERVPAFIGSRCFSRVNRVLKAQGTSTIVW